MNDNIIFHIVKKSWWETQKEKDHYLSESYHEENFIHCSTRAQLHATANRYYLTEPLIYLLHLDTALLSSELKYEMSPSLQQFFPHIYGPINKQAIIMAEELMKPAGDTWRL
ncbi:MAG: DUF952 domain-containing protein [Chitinophagaceae bacterium]|nr:DUF952 domain-containing protein [Chitinophagaceae bacterium]